MPSRDLEAFSGAVRSAAEGRAVMQGCFLALPQEPPRGSA